MGCILACLRFNDDHNKKKAHLKSSPVPSKIKEPLLLKHQFASVFVSADLNSQDNIDNDILEGELRDEVKFLKCCGAILETPAELRKASPKLITQPSNKDITYSNSSSCLPGKPFKKLVWDEQQEDSNFAQNSSLGFNFGEHEAHSDSYLSLATQRNSVFLELGPESAVLDVSPSQDDTQIQPHGTESVICFGNVKLYPGTESGLESAVSDVPASQDDTQIHALGSGVVCLGSDKHDSGIEPGVSFVVSDVSPSQDDTQIKPFGSKHSPYPTPIKLTGEMETPGTIYPADLESLKRKNARVRMQYVYPVLKPVENLTHWTELREGPIQLGQAEKAQQAPVASSPSYQKDKRSPNREEFDKENYGSVKRLKSLTPLSDSRWKVTLSPENRQVMVSSLSQWLKPPPGDYDKNQTETRAVKFSCPDRTPNVDRPIFGVVAMHWNDDGDPSPKWWGGNGIPNTTTKYKEDQKVSWHATPFEERLDKALSDDKLFPGRNDISRNLVGVNDESEESDQRRTRVF